MGTFIEIVLSAAVIILLCFILRVSFETMMLIGGAVIAGAIILTLLAMLILFVYSTFMVMLSKPVKARFYEIKPAKKGRYPVTHYDIGGNVYPSLYPSEFGMKNVFYKRDKQYIVMLNRKKGYVFDKFAITTIVLGLILSAAGLIIFTKGFIPMFS